MRNTWTIARRTFKAYFASPVAYVLGLVILLWVGGIFTAVIYYSSRSFGQAQAPGVDFLIYWLIFPLLFAFPALTMHLLSEEQRLGTLELLLTAPVRDWEVVVGKWLGSFLFVLTIIAITWIYPIILNRMVQPGIDQGLLLSGYLGVVLISAALLGVGTAVSSLFSSQIASFLISLGFNIIMWFITGIFSQVTDPPVSTIMGYLSLQTHFQDQFLTGVIELSAIVYLLSMTALALFLGTISVEVRRWR